ncbi:WxL domain-containing protein, partial [Enterococcus faecalis]
MKQTKWQRLATIGLCSSLVINAFSGVTAVAETITIESSPTVASSAKEATSASSATPASTESSQETTETSREEVTQETEKPEVVKEETQTEAKKQEEETVTSEVVQPNPVLAPTPVSGIGVRAGNLTDIHQQLRVIADNFREEGLDKPSYKVTVPETRLGVVFNSLDNTSLNMTDFDITAKTAEYLEYYTSKTWSADVDVKTIKTNNSIDMVFPQKELSASAPFVSNTNTRDLKYKFLKPINITFPKYIENIQLGTNEGYHLFSLSRASVGGVFGVYNKNFTINYTLSKLNDSSYTLSTDYAYQIMNTPGQTSTRIYELQLFNNRTYQGYADNTFQMTAPKKDINLIVTHKKVTESFKDTAGATIPAPTGFTQGKQTSITSNNYTFKQAGTLPETYKASNGKTYKFKGWYKGKTKPNTLTTTKAPSYAVTYDDNDDLNVVYEEATEFPEETFQFGFVNQDGNLVKPDDIVISYDYVAYTGRRGVSSSFVYNTIAPNQKAGTSGNLKNVVLPKDTVPLPQKAGDHNGNTAINFAISLPKYYTGLSIYDKTGKINSKYPLPPSHFYKNNVEINGFLSDSTFAIWLAVDKATNGSYVRSESLTNNTFMSSSFPRMRRDSSYIQGVENTYFSFDAPVYYHLTQHKVTENFVDATGAKITPPTGFTQGKQTGIDSDPYTFKQAGTLPDTYKAGTKTYKFKGWYKGKTKPNTLTTTKAPSYAVTYDDNDDLNVVYEEINFPETTYQFGFVNEAGQLVNPDDISLTYDYKSIVYRGTGAAGSTVSFGTIANNQSGVKVGNLRQVTLPAKNIAQPTVVGWNGEAFANFSINLPKYYKSLNLYDKTGKIDPKYPLPVKTTVSSVSNDTVQPEANVIAELTLTQRADGSFTPREIYSGIDSSVRYPPFLRRTVSYSSSGSITALYQTISGPVYYHLTNRKVTENFVNTSGAKITPPTGFTQGNQIPMTSNTFKYTSAKALPASYSAGGKTYVFQGWYKGKTKPNTLTTSTTPAYNTTFDDNDDMTAVYKEASISANLTMRGAVDVIDNGAAMEYWEVLLKNTGEAPLTSVKIKPTTDWAAGISTPTELFILGTGQNTKEQWEAGFEIPLDSSIPVGGQLTINLLGTKVTGQPNQVLKAAVEVTGNFNKLTASDTVRIKDLDQETKEPTGEGFISVPTFNFGQVGVAGSTQQHSLKKAADYYGNGTRNPYLRIKKTQPNWSLTAQLSQPKSATDSLPTATRLLLGAAPVSSFSNYNQPTELKNAVGTTSAISLNANNTATRIIAN